MAQGPVDNFGQANSAASKAGVAAFTKSLAKELAAKGVTVNAVAPGFVETDMVDGIPEKAHHGHRAVDQRRPADVGSRRCRSDRPRPVRAHSAECYARRAGFDESSERPNVTHIAATSAAHAHGWNDSTAKEAAHAGRA